MNHNNSVFRYKKTCILGKQNCRKKYFENVWKFTFILVKIGSSDNIYQKYSSELLRLSIQPIHPKWALCMFYIKIKHMCKLWISVWITFCPNSHQTCTLGQLYLSYARETILKHVVNQPLFYRKNLKIGVSFCTNESWILKTP